MSDHFRFPLCYMHAPLNLKSLCSLKWRSPQKGIYRHMRRFIQMKGNGTCECPFSTSSLFVLCPSCQRPVGSPGGTSCF